ncbi:MAG: flagellar biosynthesis protein FlhB [Alphaproteobacteria bacterium]|nr:flagellar biosynthesis protein FlhB [Alphaproteobacteria bacterium]
MADDNEKDDDQKTQEPTQRRLDDAQKDGQAPNSREVTHWCMIALSATVLLGVMPSTARNLGQILVPFLCAPHTFVVTYSTLNQLGFHLLKEVSMALLLPMLILSIGALVVGLLQTWSALSLKTLAPKLDRLSLSKGFNKIFSKQALLDFLKSLLKVIILGVALFFTLKKQLQQLAHSSWFSINELGTVFRQSIQEIFVVVLCVLAVIAGLDYIYQRFQFTKKLRMTLQEVKDEHKDSEGDPAIRQKLRQMRQEMIRNQMMKAVPSATAVITNPTHYAVAIAWDQAVMESPKVVAKGKDHVAFRIREIAKKNDIPIIENPPLARSLFDSVDINREIQSHHYKAVADVIKLVMKLKQRRF